MNPTTENPMSKEFLFELGALLLGLLAFAYLF